MVTRGGGWTGMQDTKILNTALDAKIFGKWPKACFPANKKYTKIAASLPLSHSIAKYAKLSGGGLGKKKAEDREQAAGGSASCRSSNCSGRLKHTNGKPRRQPWATWNNVCHKRAHWLFVFCSSPGPGGPFMWALNLSAPGLGVKLHFQKTCPQAPVTRVNWAQNQ